eukprot:TRINITY_DN9926_c0_g1_i1.p1 TRINITY_DN9926_c0_g1~~TRINITY_DN9926_c0_g1_i1.p1  ORF type:complete len:232 (+),score=47.44 TRINITY_DN9926_c0_g1_i1:140-835(+)
MCIIGFVGFFTATWEEFYSGLLYLGPINGAVEGSSMVQLCFLLAAFFGKGFFGTPCKLFFGHTFGTALAFLFIFPFIFTVVGNFVTVFKSCAKKGISKLSALYSLLPAVILTASYASFLLISDSGIMNVAPRVFLLAWGFSFSYAVCNMMVCYICDLFYQPHFLAVYLSLLLPINACLHIVPDWFVVYSLFFLSSVQTLVYIVCIANEFANELKIKIFTAVPKKFPPKKEE